MTLRNVPGALALGLLAALTAHAALYGGQHAEGGTYHDLLMQITSAAALGFVAFAGALAWAQSGTSTEGSVVAARLRERLPEIGSIVAFATLWYVGIEAIEPHHVAARPIALVVALIAASYAALQLARGITVALARAAIAISRTPYSPRAFVLRRRSRGRPIALHSFLARRRFARPPPVAFA